MYILQSIFKLRKFFNKPYFILFTNYYFTYIYIYMGVTTFLYVYFYIYYIYLYFVHSYYIMYKNKELTYSYIPHFTYIPKKNEHKGK